MRQATFFYSYYYLHGFCKEKDPFIRFATSLHFSLYQSAKEVAIESSCCAPQINADTENRSTADGNNTEQILYALSFNVRTIKIYITPFKSKRKHPQADR